MEAMEANESERVKRAQLNRKGIATAINRAEGE